MQPNRYLAVRTHSDDTWSHFYVVDTATGLALTTYGTWGDAKASAELANEDLEEIHKGQSELCAAYSAHLTREIERQRRVIPRWQCSQCKRILPENALVGTCPDCRGNRLERVGTV